MLNAKFEIRLGFDMSNLRAKFETYPSSTFLAMPHKH